MARLGHLSPLQRVCGPNLPAHRLLYVEFLLTFGWNFQLFFSKPCQLSRSGNYRNAAPSGQQWCLKLNSYGVGKGMLLRKFWVEHSWLRFRCPCSGLCGEIALATLLKPVPALLETLELAGTPCRIYSNFEYVCYAVMVCVYKPVSEVESCDHVSHLDSMYRYILLCIYPF